MTLLADEENGVTNGHGGGSSSDNDKLKEEIRKEPPPPSSDPTKAASSTKPSILKHTTSNPLKDQITLWTCPIQRQSWNDTQIHPVVNWGDLFFDLFYVGAAYNLSYIIVYDPTNEGLLYFLGAFFSIMTLWMDKTFYDARFFTRDDLFHRAFEVLGLAALATAVVHIRPVYILSQSSKYVDMFGLSLGLLAGTFVTLCRFGEIMVCVEGGPEAKIEAKRSFLVKVIPFVVNLAATIISGIAYFSNDKNGATYYSASHDVNETYHNETDYHDDGHRVLAEVQDDASQSANNVNHVPISLIFAGSVAYILTLFVVILCFMPKGGKHKAVSVPVNISFVIHRYGEWVMLMLGESILSLVIVDVLDPAPGYYLTFYSGIVSVVLLQYLHYRSQPHHPDEHALRRSKAQGFTFTILMAIYSAGLVLVGTSFKMLVEEHAMAGGVNDSGHRFLYSSSSSTLTLRMLAAGGGGGGSSETFTKQERQQRIANFFCESMAVVWLTSDLLMIIHKGVKDNIGRCKCQHTHKQKKSAIVLILLKLGLIAFIATFPLYLTDPTSLALVGLGGIVSQVCLRFIGSAVFPDTRVHHADDSHDHDNPEGKPKDQIIEEDENADEDEKWPNVTHAAARPSLTYESGIRAQYRSSCPPAVLRKELQSL